MPPWLTDSAVVVAMVTVMGGTLSTFINASVNRKDRLIKDQYDDIKDDLMGLMAKMRSIDETTVQTKIVVETTQDGTKKIQRYRLFNDLKTEIEQGWTTLENYRELSILFESYKNLGGNGEIEALYAKYKELPIREED